MTRDCFTAVGSVSLAHADRRQVEADHKRVRLMEQSMFVVEAEGSGGSE